MMVEQLECLKEVRLLQTMELYVECLKELIAAGADINKEDNRTALMAIQL